ncbi:MAG TPA: hypothetical protein VMH89_07305 [Candidatus Acidoferrum sp.]|jgi:hypothetical protein|nr:hypothetical protein [Candidatus Acidoferrum sp.]
MPRSQQASWSQNGTIKTGKNYGVSPGAVVGVVFALILGLIALLAFSQ